MAASSSTRPMSGVERDGEIRGRALGGYRWGERRSQSRRDHLPDLLRSVEVPEPVAPQRDQRDLVGEAVGHHLGRRS